MMRDLGRGLDTDEPSQRRIAAHLLEAGFMRRVPEQVGQQDDAPERGDGLIITSPTARGAECLEDGGVGDRLEGASDRTEGGAVLEFVPSEQGLGHRDPHPPDPPSGAGGEGTP
jgi:hypothetical protein